MTDTTNTTNVKNNKSNRAPYNFKLNFPETFTLRDLRQQKSHKIKYITLYARVQRALKNGEIVISGEKAPAKARRGRKELIFSRADAKTAILTSAPTAATV